MVAKLEGDGLVARQADPVDRRSSLVTATAAGAELNVSAAAVSRMVHLLEERLEVALFERKANRLVTTVAGVSCGGLLSGLGG